MTQTLIGKPAHTLIVRCPHCRNDSFLLLAVAPAGVHCGDEMPKGKYVVRVLECTACGEQTSSYFIGVPK